MIKINYIIKGKAELGNKIYEKVIFYLKKNKF